MHASKNAQPEAHVGRLTVEYRTGMGTSSVRKLRAAGMIPGICYGKGEEPFAVSLNPKELQRALDPEKRTNTLITMTVERDGAGQDYTVMLRDWQTDTLKGNLLHADFQRVRLDQEVTATVPLLLTGKAEGVKLGGTLHQVYRDVQIACTPDKIPNKIEIAVDNLGMGDALHVSDLKLPPGVRVLLDAGTTVCTVTVPKAEKVAVAEGAEGAAPAEGAAAAAPAAGAAAAPAAKEGAKPAAAAAKPAEKKGDKK